MTNNDWKEIFKRKFMRRLLVSIVVLLCLSSVSFAAPKKKKAAPMDDAPEVTFDVDSCVDKAIDYRTLLTTNPYDNVGKCYWLGFPMVKTQLFSRSVALIGFAGAQQNVFALMDFGKESVPMSGPITGLVMGLGAYEYTTVDRSRNTVHHLRKLDGYLKRTKKQQQEKDALDKKKADEQEKERVEAQRIEEQERPAREKAAELARQENEKKQADELMARNNAEKKRIEEEKMQNQLNQKKLERLERYQADKASRDREKSDKEIAALKESGFEVNGDVLTDKNSGLMWNIGKHTVVPRYMYSLRMQAGGYDDWHVPSMSELKTLSAIGVTKLNKLGIATENTCYLSWKTTGGDAVYYCIYLKDGELGLVQRDHDADFLPVRGGGLTNWLKNVVM